MQKEYYTVAHEAFVEIEERKSKFIGFVKPVETAEEATSYINEIKSNHKDATHNCYAYYVCKDMFAQRFSDDGEPSGTAGIPILEVIKRNNIQNVVVVVTRYFGGILLGAPGLIRAYSKSASEAIVKATKVKRIYCQQIKVTIEYTLLGKMQNAILSKGYIIKEINYGQDVEIIVSIPIDEIDVFRGAAREIASGDVLFEDGSTYYINEI